MPVGFKARIAVPIKLGATLVNKFTEGPHNPPDFRSAIRDEPTVRSCAIKPMTATIAKRPFFLISLVLFKLVCGGAFQNRCANTRVVMSPSHQHAASIIRIEQQLKAQAAPNHREEVMSSRLDRSQNLCTMGHGILIA